MAEAEFIARAVGDPGKTWDHDSVQGLASLQVPDIVLGRQKLLLRADIHEQWAKWFVESLGDPRQYADVSYPYIFEDVLTAIDRRFGGNYTRPQRFKLASTAARVIQGYVGVYVRRRRSQISKKQRSFMIDLAGSPPRCWICGLRFSEVAIDNFVFQQRTEIPLPKFIDILKPIGLKQRDLSIELDHVVAHALGGEESDNLRIACGWCNRHKSSLVSIYDVEGRPRASLKRELGFACLPHPFWTVRMLAVIRRCEHVDGCERSAEADEMTVAPVTESGAMNPTNLRVTCYEHDPIRLKRRQSHRATSEIWGRA